MDKTRLAYNRSVSILGCAWNSRVQISTRSLKQHNGKEWIQIKINAGDPWLQLIPLSDAEIEIDCLG